MSAVDEITIVHDQVKTFLDNMDWKGAILEGKEPTMPEIPLEILDKFYDAGLTLVEQKRWVDAKDVFSLLAFLVPQSQAFWMGLGLVEQSMGNFQQALVGYLVAYALDAEDPPVNANIYQCLVALGNKEGAEVFFKSTIECCDKREGFEDLKNSVIEYSKRVPQ
ncbi:MAG: tetratricopeptide repeat protein [Parachlamydiaceae bacterium]|nr:tetratricopeptide repeat protein [Parachlamydiaceae bacterium]